MLEFGPDAPAPRRAVFLDRDGVLITNRDDYVRSELDIELLPGAPAAVRCLADAGFAVVVVVSNQAMVGHGLISAETARAVHARVVADFAEHAATFTAGYLCPHTPADGCDCRKPRPGMILHAAARLDLDLSRSFLIGDAATDVEAASAAGVEPFLVLTGRGRQQSQLPAAVRLPADNVQPDVLSAARVIVARAGG